MKTLKGRIFLPKKKHKSRCDRAFELLWHVNSAAIIVAAAVDSDKLVRTSSNLIDILPAVELEGALFTAPAWPYTLLVSLVVAFSRTMALDLFA